MRFKPNTVMAAAGLCLAVVGLALAAESNVYWRVDLNQGSSVIAYGIGATEDGAKQDCARLRAITRAMTAAETRKGAVAAITSDAVRWCKNPMQLATVRPDPVTPPVSTAVLSWEPPVQNTNGTMLIDLAGYRISYGTSAEAMTQTLQVANPTSIGYTIANLPPGTYFFAVRAYTSAGTESALSNTVSKVVL